MRFDLLIESSWGFGFFLFGTELAGDLGGGGDGGFGGFGFLFLEMFANVMLLDEAAEGTGHDVEIQAGRCVIEKDEHDGGHHIHHHLLLLAGLGIVIAAAIVGLLLSAASLSLTAAWQRIALRVAGSWIAAIGLLAIAWQFRSVA